MAEAGSDRTIQMEDLPDMLGSSEEAARSASSPEPNTLHFLLERLRHVLSRECVISTLPRIILLYSYTALPALRYFTLSCTVVAVCTGRSFYIKRRFPRCLPWSHYIECCISNPSIGSFRRGSWSVFVNLHDYPSASGLEPESKGLS